MMVSLLQGQDNGQQRITPPAPILDPIGYEKSRVALWKSALRDMYGPLTQNLLIDINRADLASSPPRLNQPNPRPDLGVVNVTNFETIVSLSSSFLHRKVVPQKGGWVFVRDASAADTANARYEAALRWLESVKQSELTSLLNDGVPFANLSPESKTIFAKFCNNRGLQKKMANGEFASAEVRLSFVGSYKDSQGQRKTILLDLGSRMSETEDARRDKLQRTYARPLENPQPKPKPELGELSFEKGDLLLIEDVVKLANATFNRNIFYDGRFSKCYCYIQGHFTKESFLKYMKVMSPMIEWEYVKTLEECRDEIVGAIRKIVAPLVDLNRAPKGITFDQLLQGSTLRGREMYDAFPPLKQILQQLKLSEETPFVLSPALTIQMVADGNDLEPEDRPGSSPIGNSWSMTLGNR